MADVLSRLARAELPAIPFVCPEVPLLVGKRRTLVLRLFPRPHVCGFEMSVDCLKTAL